MTNDCRRDRALPERLRGRLRPEVPTLVTEDRCRRGGGRWGGSSPGDSCSERGGSPASPAPAELSGSGASVKLRRGQERARRERGEWLHLALERSERRGACTLNGGLAPRAHARDGDVNHLHVALGRPPARRGGPVRPSAQRGRQSTNRHGPLQSLVVPLRGAQAWAAFAAMYCEPGSTGHVSAWPPASAQRSC